MALNKATLSEQIYDILKQDILSQTIKQGEKLTLKALQERFDVSSTPIREALTRLSEEGLTNYYSNVGVAVISLRSKDVKELYQFIGDMDALAIEYSSNSPKLNELCSKLTAITERSNEIEKLKAGKNITDAEKETLSNEWANLSDTFHLIFYDYCDNERLAKAAARQRSQLTILSRMYQKDAAVQAQIEKSHVDIYNAFMKKDYSNASLLMKEHLKESMNYALFCLKNSQVQ